MPVHSLCAEARVEWTRDGVQGNRKSMPTINQLITKGRRPLKSHNKVPALQACPQKRGVCTRVYTTTPMERGKKSVAERVVYGALDEVQSKLKQDPVPAFHEALENVKPAVEVRSRRVGGATYQVPVEVRPERRQALAIRWIIQAARDRSGHSMMEKLSAELMDALNGRDNAVSKREDNDQMADA